MKQTQTKKILDYLRPKGRTISPMLAFSKFGITCLAERIRDIRADGHNITAEMVSKNGKRYAKYSLQ